jgi:phage/plasmid-associated DNA primase
MNTDHLSGERIELVGGLLPRIGDPKYIVNTTEDIWKGQYIQPFAQLKYLTDEQMNHSDIARRMRKLCPSIDENELIAFELENKISRVFQFCPYVGQWKELVGYWHVGTTLIDNMRRQLKLMILDPLKKLIQKLIKKSEKNQEKGQRNNDRGDGSEGERIAQDRLRILTKLYKDLGDNQVKQSVINQIYNMAKADTLVYSHKLENFGVKPGYIGLEDGVFSFKENRLLRSREEAKELYITHCLDFSYEDVQRVDAATYMACVAFVEAILPNEPVRTWLMRRYYKAMSGALEKLILICHGPKGNNGKTQLLDKLLSAVFGDHFVKVSNQLLNPNKHASAGNSNEELMSMKNKLFILFSEPDRNKPLHMSLLKEVAGGDGISGRQLYKSKQVFRVIGLINILCNEIPPLDATDKGTFNRIRCVPFTSSFVTDPSLVDPSNHVYLANEYIDREFSKWKPAFFKYLMTFTHDVPEPQEVLEHTKRFQQREDVMQTFVADRVVEDESSHLCRTELWMDWKNWKKDNDESVQLRKREFDDKIMDYFPCAAFKSKTNIRTNGDIRSIRNVWKGYRLINRFDAAADAADAVDL